MLSTINTKINAIGQNIRISFHKLINKFKYDDLTLQEIALSEDANGISIMFAVITQSVIYDFKKDGVIVYTIKTSITRSRIGHVTDNLQETVGSLVYPAGSDLDGDYFVIASNIIKFG